MVFAVGLALLGASCAGGGNATSSSRESDAAGNGGQGTANAALRPFSAATLDGEDFASTELAGKSAVLWFWAPWCTVCRAEAPDVVGAAEILAGEVQVIGVAGRGDVSEMRRFVADTGTDGLTHVLDADGSIWSQYRVFAQPAFAFVGRDGSVEVFVGSLGRDALVERMIVLAEA
jgi:thiol-disulfide isomerase/thioredoxin